MTAYAFALFDTAFGRAGLAWGAGGLRAVSFPSRDEAKVRARLLARAPDAALTPPSGRVAALSQDIAALFEGERRDFRDADLDLEGVAAFDRDVLALTLDIPHGDTRTYGDLARALGDVGLSRRVGQALGRNPFPIVVPCHRVVGAAGAMTGFSAPGGAETKRRLLKLEGAIAPELFD